MTKPQSTAAYVLRLTLTLFLITVIVAGLLADARGIALGLGNDLRPLPV